MGSDKVVLFVALLSTTQAILFGSKEVCYDQYGCFSNAKPFNNAKGNLPDSPEKQGINFSLNTIECVNQVINVNDFGSIRDSYFNPDLKTILIIHGYTDDGGAAWVVEMVDELLYYQDANVIVVDWKDGAGKINYFKAVANTRVVGAVAAQLIQDLKSVFGISYSDVHVIGHSLGAHTGGYIGEIISGLGRITGLDPAGLGFENYDAIVRLDPSDADYVDVIHTDGGTIRQLAFGTLKALGDADFYPNDGKKQPGCPTIRTTLLDIFRDKLSKLPGNVACSHMRAIDLFTESINSECTFFSFPCSSWDNFHSDKCTMGYHSNKETRGEFYLKTASEEPFCIDKRRFN
ncbi:hypothetical protein SNE40_004654 [Patella caerulea]|uniref:Lipase domain-containing protein n=1 Tax=Patella caerulea TaxID=87958 RepID=A0AAN8KA00_PATCE